MDSEPFAPALSQVFGSQARTKLVAVLVERPEEWLSAAKLCDLADVSQSGFHRDHKSILIDFELMERRNATGEGQTSPQYTLADTRQAECAVELHCALQSQLESSGILLEGNVEQFVR